MQPSADDLTLFQQASVMNNQHLDTGLVFVCVKIKKERNEAHCAEHQLVCAITPVLQIMQLDLCAKGLWLL